MKKINVKITEGHGCGKCGECDACNAAAPFPADRHMDKIAARDKHMHTSDCDKSMPNSHAGEEGRMHRTTLAHLMADVKVLLDLIDDEDDLPEWLETKITKAGDYMSSAARYIAGNEARDQGQLEEGMCDTSAYHHLYEQLQGAVDEDGGSPCPECLYEAIVESATNPDLISEAKYKGRKVKLNKRMRGDVKKFKVFVRGCGKKKDTVKKINFGDKNMKIKKNIPGRRKSFRARHKCHTAKDKCTARYWSCRAW